MRRKDREVTGREGISGILDACQVMRIAFNTDDAPYVVPMFFAYEWADDVLHLFFHCAVEGRKLDLLKKDERVGFEADRVMNLHASSDACEWTADFESVVGEGHIKKLEDVIEKREAMDCIMRRYGFEGEPVYRPGALEKTVLLKITATAVTAKRKG